MEVSDSCAEDSTHRQRCWRSSTWRSESQRAIPSAPSRPLPTRHWSVCRAEFDQVYSKVGRASVPPERLLKASLLISLYSVRSERAFCEELEYNLLFRWFLDMNLMERSFDPTVFTKNRRRLLEHRIGQALFD